MNTGWMLCLAGTVALSILMAANGSWRRHPALFVYLLLVTGKSAACWALWDSHLYFYAYYGFTAAEQLTQIWIMVELSVFVTAASPAVEQFIKGAIPTVAGVALLWTACGIPNATRETPSLPWIASHLDTAVSMAWALSLIVVLIALTVSGCQFSQGARGIALGFLLEVLVANVAAFLYVHAPNVSYLGHLKVGTFGVSLLFWTVALAHPRGASFAFPLRSLATPAVSGAPTKGTPGQ